MDLPDDDALMAHVGKVGSHCSDPGHMGLMKTGALVAAKFFRDHVAGNYGGHEWFYFGSDGYRSCKKCGIVERADRANRPCRGRVRITVREKDFID